MVEDEYEVLETTDESGGSADWDENRDADIDTDTDADDDWYDDDDDEYPEDADESSDDGEIVRVRTTDADEDARVDGGRDTRMVPEGAEDKVRKLRLPAFISKFISGAILNTSAVKENYRYVICIMAMLLLSIAMFFTSLGSYIRHDKLVQEVQLLREKSIRMNERRNDISSHAAIVNRLREVGSDLKDPTHPQTAIE